MTCYSQIHCLQCLLKCFSPFPLRDIELHAEKFANLTILVSELGPYNNLHTGHRGSCMSESQKFITTVQTQIEIDHHHDRNRH